MLILTKRIYESHEIFAAERPPARKQNSRCCCTHSSLLFLRYDFLNTDSRCPISTKIFIRRVKKRKQKKKHTITHNVVSLLRAAVLMSKTDLFFFKNSLSPNNFENFVSKISRKESPNSRDDFSLSTKVDTLFKPIPKDR